jgi:hypothetical protein
MPDEEGILEALQDMEIVEQAREHFQSVDAYQNRLISRLRRLHHFAYPMDGDQWPEDQLLRPEKIHMTANLCKPAIDVDARMQALIPRIVQEPNGTGEEERASAEAAEKIMQRFLELSGWDLWMSDLTRIKCAYGYAVLKPFWNVKENRPDAVVIENPSNLRVGWGSSDFRDIDWALYEYSISPIEVMRRFPDVVIVPNKGGRPTVMKHGGDHADPLDQKHSLSRRPQLQMRPIPYQESEYESQQVTCWDYWFKDVKDVVWNAIIIDGEVIGGEVARHRELMDIPYIVIENDHEPSMPWGIATHEAIIDLQIEMNRALSHAAQIIADEIDPAWQINSMSVPDGVVPRSGEIVATGDEGAEIKAIPKSVNFPPVVTLIEEFKDQYHDITGLPRILFGTSPGSQTTGRALAVQVEAAANRLDFKRRRLYQGLRELLIYWAFMVEKRKLKTGGFDVGAAVSGFRRWKIIAPEITPKDVIEASNNAIQKVNAKIISLQSAREELGYDSPKDEEKLVIEERSNVDLFPGDVQVKTAVLQALQALTMQQQQMGAQQAGADAQGQMVAQEQGLAPGRAEDDNQQPATVAGGPAPAGGPQEGSTVATALIRPTTGGQAQALNQLATQRRIT